MSSSSRNSFAKAFGNCSKTSFEKNCFSAWASTLNMGLINKVDMVWCLADVSSVSPSSEQTGKLWAIQCLNSW